MNILLFTIAAFAGSGRSVHRNVPGTSSHGSSPLFVVSSHVTKIEKASGAITYVHMQAKGAYRPSSSLPTSFAG